MESRSQVNGTEKGMGKGMRGGKGRKKRQKIDNMKSARNGQTMHGDDGAHRGWESEVQRDTHPADFSFLQQHPGLLNKGEQSLIFGLINGLLMVGVDRLIFVWLRVINLN